jgi:hypothetical protein
VTDYNYYKTGLAALKFGDFDETFLFFGVLNGIPGAHMKLTSVLDRLTLTTRGLFLGIIIVSSILSSDEIDYRLINFLCAGVYEGVFTIFELFELLGLCLSIPWTVFKFSKTLKLLVGVNSG